MRRDTHVALGVDSSMADPLALLLDTTTATTLAAPPLEPDSTYFWRVRSTSATYTSAWSATYRFSTGAPLVRLYYLTDHLGSVRETVNDSGRVVHYDDYPFGPAVLPKRKAGRIREQAGGEGIIFPRLPGSCVAGSGGEAAHEETGVAAQAVIRSAQSKAQRDPA